MRRHISIYEVFTDVGLASAMIFFMLFVLSILMVNPPEKEGNTEIKAEFIVTLEWPSGNKSDVDLVVKHPTGVTFYQQREIGGVSLDRDDLGSRLEVIKLDDGTIVNIEENWEHVFIRKMIPGDYTVNVHMFNLAGGATPATVKVEKLNPFRTLISKTVVLDYNKQEETILNFTLDAEGKISNTNAEFQPIYPNKGSKDSLDSIGDVDDSDEYGAP